MFQLCCRLLIIVDFLDFFAGIFYVVVFVVFFVLVQGGRRVLFPISSRYIAARTGSMLLALSVPRIHRGLSPLPQLIPRLATQEQDDLPRRQRILLTIMLFPRTHRLVSRLHHLVDGIQTRILEAKQLAVRKLRNHHLRIHDIPMRDAQHREIVMNRVTANDGFRADEGEEQIAGLLPAVESSAGLDSGLHFGVGDAGPLRAIVGDVAAVGGVDETVCESLAGDEVDDADLD